MSQEKPKKRKRGQPKKSTPERLNRFIKATRAGATRKHAAAFAGLSLAAAESYLKKGKDGDPEYVKFLERVQEAEGQGVVENLKTIRAHAKRDWRAGAWILNNRHGDEYKSKQVVAGDPDAPLSVREVLIPAQQKADG